MFRVLNIHWGFIPGGIAKYAASLKDVESFAPLRMKSICIHSPKWPIDRLSASKIEMEFISIGNRFDLSWIWRVKKTIRQEKPNLIFTYGFNGNFVAAITTIGQRVPIVSSWHGKYLGTTLLQKLRAPIFNWISTILLKYSVKNIVTVSEYSKNILIRQSIKKEKIKRIYSGLPLSEINEINCLHDKRKSNNKSEELLAGTLCRLDTTKDLPTLLRAISIISNKTNRIKFIVWGEGPQKKKLIKLAKKLNIENMVKFPGYEHDIDKCLRTLDIFVLPSILENFSIALLEAMRSGLAIITTNIGGNPEAVNNNEHAILIPPDAPEELARGILKFAKSKILREKMGSAAQERFLNVFTNDKMLRETANWLLCCAKKKCDKPYTI